MEYKGKKELKEILNWLEPYAKKHRVLRPIDQYDGFPRVFKLEESNLNESVLENEKPIILHLKKGKIGHSAMQEIVTQFENEFRYYEVDIELNEWAKSVFKSKEIPSISYLPPGMTDKLNKSLIFYKNESLDAIS